MSFEKKYAKDTHNEILQDKSLYPINEGHIPKYKNTTYDVAYDRD